MKKATLKKVLPVAIAIVVGVFLVLAMRYWFDHSSSVQSLFYGDNSNAVIGEVAEDSGASLADRSQMAARLSMYIFTVITVLQLVAFGVGCAVVSGVKQASGSVKKRLALLDNCEIFFDVPLYVGLFGTVSAFLVMTFSPQSSRLIAYSSTLIGIIFSLVLRLTMQYPLRRSLIAEQEREGADTDKEQAK